MNRARMAKLAVTGVALSGMLLNGLYGIQLTRTLADPTISAGMRDVAISAIALEFSWAVLLGWAALRPIERRDVILVTVLPILLGNVLHTAFQLAGHEASPVAAAINIAVGLVYAGLYVAAYLMAKPGRTQSSYIA